MRFALASLALVVLASCEHLRLATRDTFLVAPVDAAQFDRVLRAARPHAEIGSRSDGDEFDVWVAENGSTVNIHIVGTRVVMWTDFGGSDPSETRFASALSLQHDLASALDTAGITRGLADSSVTREGFSR